MLALKAEYIKKDQKRRYLWWNEVPVDRSWVMDVQKHDAMFVKLPADICKNGEKAADDSVDGAQLALDADPRPAEKLL